MGDAKSRLSVQGAWEVKRHFTLPASTGEASARAIAERLSQLAGVRGTRADIGRHRLSVAYDVTQLDYRHVLETLTEAGLPAPIGWWSRLKAAWFQNMDETGRANARAPMAPCCNNPKVFSPPKK